ncbi:MAG: BlaI/MecI/CopY family transcriptional regulator [Erysipelotrichaceae bacterium]|jgi:predicted transcriptional regulator|nr:BlaI/MecI/CopY family transcriptional regulator [Erysipelotrichaceae bacterium]
MKDIRLGVIEERFAGMIWDNEPVPSGELAAMAEAELSWKKSTTYTILKRLCDRGIFQNENGIVTSLISRELFYSIQSEKFVDETFHGSLPAFLAAFSKRRACSDDEIEEMKQLIEKMREKK